ncbi:hypothetical protein J3F83DRAFT_749678 [Trichoderma novae-zelandiae]
MRQPGYEMGHHAGKLYKVYLGNLSSTLCSTLQPKQPVCCSAGTLPSLAHQPSANCTCATYTVKNGDCCDLIALNNYITTTNIKSWSKQTWGWTGW